ncbi:lipocalin family protein [Aquimarina sp. 2304DJ70-9]|uniref:lipocalin family protein n=1 Tax=Aquimarina penaris TaxID=3231044 RepID=UPI003462805C
MKKLSLLVLLITCVFISCSDDDDATPSPVVFNEVDLVGKWQITVIEENGVVLELSDCEKKDLSNFSISENGEKIASFTENIEDNNTCSEFISNIYSWTLGTGNVLTTSFGSADTEIQTIIELTDTTLILQSQDTEMVNGQVVTIIYTDTYTYLGEPEIPEDNSSINESDLIGTWQLTSATENGEEYTNACTQRTTVDFKENGTVDFVLYAEDNAGQCSIDSSFASPWSLSENVINYDVDDEPETIIELTSTTLKLQYTIIEGNEQFVIVNTYTKK